MGNCCRKFEAPEIERVTKIDKNYLKQLLVNDKKELDRILTQIVEIKQLNENEKNYLKGLIKDDKKAIDTILRQIDEENDNLEFLNQKSETITKEVKEVSSLLEKLARSQNSPQMKQLK